MTSLWKILSGAGAAIIGIVSLFFYAKGKGKEESKNEQRKQIIENIEKRHKIDIDVDNTDIDDLRNELRDPNNKN